MNRAELGLTGADKADIRAKVRGLLTDPDMGSWLTVVTPTAATLATASGTLTRTTTENEVRGYMGPLTTREIEASSAYQEGDQRVCVMANDLTVEPTAYSWVEVGGEKYAVVHHERDPLGVYRELVVRRVVQS